ncbi:uncharacterized protein LOC117534291 isoform X3 [Gymnodraco acuticeps]|uniref:Uncharacterized protein LOC117534291 isoform X3 n=1 Tax=Gymnodraco acuticeps TaxID=8218 RepID=A0A6P8SU02_GYMAC|nr:uncharacterized protein LOC117534291 isoform X3 [Gymnodraco acuticeps]
MERETVCLTELAGKGDLLNMSKVQMLLSLKKQRLTAAAEDIFALFEKTIAELEEELSLSKEENERLQKLLDAVLQPQLRIHRAGLSDLSSTGYPFPPRGTALAIRLAHLNHLHRHYKPQPCSQLQARHPHQPQVDGDNSGINKPKPKQVFGQHTSVMPFSTDSQTQRKLRRMLASHNTEGEAEEVFRGRRREARPSFDERCFKCGSVEHWIMGLLTEHWRVEAERGTARTGPFTIRLTYTRWGGRGPIERDGNSASIIEPGK